MNNIKTPPFSLRRSPVNASGSSRLCPINSSKLFCIVIIITIWAAGLLVLNDKLGHDLETYLRKSSAIININDGKEAQLDFDVDGFDKIGMSDHILFMIRAFGFQLFLLY
jgi:hypothetical protein